MRPSWHETQPDIRPTESPPKWAQSAPPLPEGEPSKLTPQQRSRLHQVLQEGFEVGGVHVRP